MEQSLLQSLFEEDERRPLSVSELNAQVRGELENSRDTREGIEGKKCPSCMRGIMKTVKIRCPECNGKMQNGWTSGNGDAEVVVYFCMKCDVGLVQNCHYANFR